MKKTALQSAEEKFQFYKQRRDEYNALAKEAREERDLLNEERKKLKEELQRERDSRDSIVKILKEKKEKKNEYREKIRALRKYVRDLRRASGNTIEAEYVKVEDGIRALEIELQTKPHSLEEENRLIARLRSLTKRKEELKKEIKKKNQVLGEVHTEDH